MKFIALGTESGSITETTETSGVGGTVSNTTTNGFYVGDTATRQQILGIAGFDTSTIPVSATINSASLTLNALTTNGSPSVLAPLQVDVNKGVFGSVGTVEAGDFEQIATAPSAASFPPTTATVATQPLNAIGLNAINKGGRTQTRLRFLTDDNNNATADRLELGSGNCSDPTRRPTLMISFTVPGP